MSNDNQLNEPLVQEPLSTVTETQAIENLDSTPQTGYTWPVITEQFLGTFSQEVTKDRGIDSIGNTIWESYFGKIIIDQESITIDLPDGQFHLTQNNTDLGVEDNFMYAYIKDGSELNFQFYNFHNVPSIMIYVGDNNETFSTYTLDREP